MKELVIISGKGGSGKTSVTASFAVLANQPVLADCDVDAADLHLVLVPRIIQRRQFYSGHQAVIRVKECIGCGACLAYCRYNAVTMEQKNTDLPQFSIDPVACEGCGVCVHFCPVQAIDFPESLCGEWMISETRCGPMVHARLATAAENSGKLVSTVRQEARRIAEKKKRSLILVDGPPGIGCPVIASLTGASQVLIVTEPTVSGQHDMERVLALTKHFKIPACICVNKWDLNPGMTDRIEEQARQAGVQTVGRIRYDPLVTQAQIQERAVVEIDAPCSDDIRQIWKKLQAIGEL